MLQYMYILLLHGLPFACIANVIYTNDRISCGQLTLIRFHFIVCAEKKTKRIRSEKSYDEAKTTAKSALTQFICPRIHKYYAGTHCSTCCADCLFKFLPKGYDAVRVFVWRDERLFERKSRLWDFCRVSGWIYGKRKFYEFFSAKQLLHVIIT